MATRVTLKPAGNHDGTKQVISIFFKSSSVPGPRAPCPPVGTRQRIDNPRAGNNVCRIGIIAAYAPAAGKESDGERRAFSGAALLSIMQLARFGRRLDNPEVYV